MNGVVRVIFALEFAAAAAISVMSLTQAPADLPPPLDAAGTAGRLGSFTLYAAAAALYLAALLTRAHTGRRLSRWLHPDWRNAVVAALAAAGIPGWTVLLFHLGGGDVWLSARVTPFTHPAEVPYLIGALSIGSVLVALLFIAQSFAESALGARPRLLHFERRLGLVAGVLCGTVIAFEGGLRFKAVFFPQTDGLGITPGTSMWLRRYARLNNSGFRDREFEPRKPGEYRIVVLGDSFVFGYGLSNTEDRATERLEQRLGDVLDRLPAPRGQDGEDPRSVRVLNVARPGADTRRELRWLERVVLPLEPDLVILGHFWNDLSAPVRPEPNAAPPGRSVRGGKPDSIRLPPRRVLRIWLQTQSALACEALRVRVLFKYRSEQSSDERLLAFADPDAYAAHLDLIASMDALAREKGIRFAVLLLPDFAFPFDGTPMASTGERLERDLRARGIYAFDLVRHLPPPFAGGRDVWVNSTDSHPGKAGHAYIADGLLKVVLEVSANPPAPGNAAAIRTEE